MLDSFHFFSPVKVFVEKDPFEVISDFLGNSLKVGVISGKVAIVKTGFRDFLSSKFSDREIFFFDEIGENPTINEVIKGGRFLRDNRVEKVIAFGGGSALDAGKACAIFATNNKSFYELLADNEYEKPLPLLAISTTCGTGSEVNHYSIITDLEKVDKINFNKPDTFPKYALLCSEYLKTLDSSLLLWTVYDAFSHALEGYLSKRSNLFSDIIAIESMRLILRNIKEFLDKGKLNLKELHFAASLAGVVILHTGTTLLHALGYYLTNNYRVQHGLANAVLMTQYIKMCDDGGVEKLEMLRKIEKEIGISIIDSIHEILGDEVERILSSVDIYKMVDYALTKSNTASTPFAVTKDYIVKHLVEF